MLKRMRGKTEHNNDQHPPWASNKYFEKFDGDHTKWVWY